MLQKTGRSVLVLDDDIDVAATFERILRSNGYHVVAFTSSNSAFDYLAQNPCKFDLVISDIKMPLMDGIEFARKAKEQLPALRIVLVTAYEMDSSDTSKLRAEGVVREVARKPMGVPQLLAIVARHSRIESEILDRIYWCQQCMAKFLFTSDVSEHQQISGHANFSEISFQ